MAVWFLGCLLVILASGSEAADCACATYAVHVRSGHGLNFPVVGTMANGQCVTFKGDRHTADGYTWAHVDYNGQVRDLFAVSHSGTRDVVCSNTSSSNGSPNMPDATKDGRNRVQKIPKTSYYYM